MALVATKAKGLIAEQLAGASTLHVGKVSFTKIEITNMDDRKMAIRNASGKREEATQSAEMSELLHLPSCHGANLVSSARCRAQDHPVLWAHTPFGDMSLDTLDSYTGLNITSEYAAQRVNMIYHMFDSEPMLNAVVDILSMIFNSAIKNFSYYTIARNYVLTLEVSQSLGCACKLPSQIKVRFAVIVELKGDCMTIFAVRAKSIDEAALVQERCDTDLSTVQQVDLRKFFQIIIQLNFSTQITKSESLLSLEPHSTNASKAPIFTESYHTLKVTTPSSTSEIKHALAEYTIPFLYAVDPTRIKTLMAVKLQCGGDNSLSRVSHWQKQIHKFIDEMWTVSPEARKDAVSFPTLVRKDIAIIDAMRNSAVNIVEYLRVYWPQMRTCEPGDKPQTQSDRLPFTLKEQDYNAVCLLAVMLVYNEKADTLATRTPFEANKIAAFFDMDRVDKSELAKEMEKACNVPQEKRHKGPQAVIGDTPSGRLIKTFQKFGDQQMHQVSRGLVTDSGTAADGRRAKVRDDIDVTEPQFPWITGKRKGPNDTSGNDCLETARFNTETQQRARLAGLDINLKGAVIKHAYLMAWNILLSATVSTHITALFRPIQVTIEAHLKKQCRPNLDEAIRSRMFILFESLQRLAAVPNSGSGNNNSIFDFSDTISLYELLQRLIVVYINTFVAATCDALTMAFAGMGSNTDHDRQLARMIDQAIDGVVMDLLSIPCVDGSNGSTEFYVRCTQWCKNLEAKNWRTVRVAATLENKYNFGMTQYDTSAVPSYLGSNDPNLHAKLGKDAQNLMKSIKDAVQHIQQVIGWLGEQKSRLGSIGNGTKVVVKNLSRGTGDLGSGSAFEVASGVNSGAFLETAKAVILTSKNGVEVDSTVKDIVKITGPETATFPAGGSTKLTTLFADSEADSLGAKIRGVDYILSVIEKQEDFAKRMNRDTRLASVRPLYEQAKKELDVAIENAITTTRPPAEAKGRIARIWETLSWMVTWTQ